MLGKKTVVIALGCSLTITALSGCSAAGQTEECGSGIPLVGEMSQSFIALGQDVSQFSSAKQTIEGQIQEFKNLQSPNADVRNSIETVSQNFTTVINLLSQYKDASTAEKETLKPQITSVGNGLTSDIQNFITACTASLDGK